ncbi:hypothetical protein [Rubripirellula tenax]|nr:hypothetical protein [Rubripirellula tenax]
MIEKVLGPPHSLSEGRRFASATVSAIGPMVSQVIAGLRRGLPRRFVARDPPTDGRLGSLLCSSPAGRTLGRFTFSFTSSGAVFGNSFVESHSVLSRIIAHAITASCLGSHLALMQRAVRFSS